MEIRSKSERCAIRVINSLEIKHGLLENTSAIDIDVRIWIPMKPKHRSPVHPW
jgi:hypothetical protein